MVNAKLVHCFQVQSQVGSKGGEVGRFQVGVREQDSKEADLEVHLCACPGKTEGCLGLPHEV